MSYAEFVKKNYDKKKSFAQNSKDISSMWHASKSKASLSSTKKGTKKKKGGMIRKKVPQEQGLLVEKMPTDVTTESHQIHQEARSYLKPKLGPPRPPRLRPRRKPKAADDITIPDRKPTPPKEKPKKPKPPKKEKEEKKEKDDDIDPMTFWPSGDGRKKKRGGRKMIPGPLADEYLATQMPRYGSGIFDKFNPPPFYSHA